MFFIFSCLYKPNHLMYTQSDMKLKFLRWLFFILCSQAFLGLAHEITLTFTHAGSEILGQIGGDKQPTGSNVTIWLDEEHGQRRYEEAKLLHLGGRKGRGNGGYGGGNIRPRPSETYGKSDASTNFARPSSIISVTLVQVGVKLLVVFYFLF